MKPSTLSAAKAWAAAAVIAVSVVLAGLLAFGHGPTATEQFVWLGAIIVLAALVAEQANELRGRHSSLESWGMALDYRARGLDNFEKQLRRRENAVIWAEGKKR